VRHHLFFSISHTHLIFINKDTIYNDNNPLSSLARDRRMKKKKRRKKWFRRSKRTSKYIQQQQQSGQACFLFSREQKENERVTKNKKNTLFNWLP